MLAATLPDTDRNENHFPISIREIQEKLSEYSSKEEVDRELYLLYIRNRILNIVMSALMNSSPSNNAQ